MRSPASALRCYWRVSAGIVPGVEDPHHALGVAMTGEEWTSPEAVKLYRERQAQVFDYAKGLMPSEINWVRVEFVWL